MRQLHDIRLLNSSDSALYGAQLHNSLEDMKWQR
jgi:hypothetical protein